jgi:ATP-dependent exoDNAse (exonuclease V) alpha subunit
LKAKDQRKTSIPARSRAYAVTSYSGQGQTADRVLVHVDTNLAARDLLNNRMAYVSVSRGQYDAQIFTNDRGALAEALGHDVSHKSAYQSAQAIAPLVQEIAETHTPKHDFGQGIGMGL